MIDFLKNNKNALIIFGVVIILTIVNLIQDKERDKEIDLPYYISGLLGNNKENLLITFIRWISIYLAALPLYNEIPNEKKYFFTKKITPILLALTAVTSRNYKFGDIRIKSKNIHFIVSGIFIASNGISLFPINKIQALIYLIFSSLYIVLFALKRILPIELTGIKINGKFIKYFEYLLFLYYIFSLDSTNYKNKKN